MFKNIELLSEILQEEKIVLAELVKVTQKERESLVNCDGVALEGCLKEKESLKDDLELQEEKRLALTGDRTLAEITAAGEQQEIEDLVNIHSEMKEILRELKALNDTNALLLRHELAYMKFMQETINPAGKATPYSSKGQRVVSFNSNAFRVSSYA